MRVAASDTTMLLSTTPVRLETKTKTNVAAEVARVEKASVFARPSDVSTR